MRLIHSGGLLVCTMLLGASAAFAQQAREPRPHNAKALCKDGTWSTNPMRGIACDTHGGVKEWVRVPHADTSLHTNVWAQCNDGTYWNHRRHLGACADHGGVKQWLRGEDSPQDRHADSVAVTRGDTTANILASGAVAKCKDGKFSHNSERGHVCLKHGGVDEWLNH